VLYDAHDMVVVDEVQAQQPQVLWRQLVSLHPRPILLSQAEMEVNMAKNYRAICMLLIRKVKSLIANMCASRGARQDFDIHLEFRSECYSQSGPFSHRYLRTNKSIKRSLSQHCASLF
jgi:hypothetical protein